MVDEKKIDTIKTSRPFKIADIIVFAAILTTAILIIVFAFSTPGEAVEISYNGQISSYPLSKNAEITVGDGHLTVIIKDGECFVEAADCPDRVCVSYGKIKNAGQSIICAPNGVLIRITGELVDYKVITG